MDMYQKRKMRQEKKNSSKNNGVEKIQLNCSIRKYATHFKNSHKIRVK